MNLLVCVLSSQINESLSILIFTFAILLVVSILRIKYANRSPKVNVRNTIVFSVYYVAPAPILVYNSFFVAGISFLYIIPYTVTVAAASFSSYVYSKKPSYLEVSQ